MYRAPGKVEGVDLCVCVGGGGGGRRGKGIVDNSEIFSPQTYYKHCCTTIHRYLTLARDIP